MAIRLQHQSPCLSDRGLCRRNELINEAGGIQANPVSINDCRWWIGETTDRQLPIEVITAFRFSIAD